MSKQIKRLVPEGLDYELIDSGRNERLERFGDVIVRRPEKAAIWHRQQDDYVWKGADLICRAGQNKRVTWVAATEKGREIQAGRTSWETRYCYSESSQDIKIITRTSSGGQVALFPEQAIQWRWMRTIIDRAAENGRDLSQVKVLNLFGYTGAASIILAQQGVQVTHIDSARPAIGVGKKNQELNELSSDAIRWIIEDCGLFVERELKRGNQYDAILLDPPPFGRGPKGQIFSFENNISELLDQTVSLLSDNPLFFLLNGYAAGQSAQTLGNLVGDAFEPELVRESVEIGELHLQEKSGRSIACSIFARIDLSGL